MNVNIVPLLDHIRRLTVPAALASCSDGTLLARFSRQHDQEAFATLIVRHGPMVFNLCRRLLGDIHAAEDAFQAAFLVLARKADGVRRGRSLAAWLHGVACRVALNARRASRRQAVRSGLLPVVEAADPRADPLTQLTGREWLAALEEEVQRLPHVYGLPVVLCCLEGLSQEEAADRLGWTAGSVKGRLERGRALLRTRLTRRGLALSAALGVLEATRADVRARVSVDLVHRTVRGALVFTNLLHSVSATPSSAVFQLAEDSVKGGTMFKRKLVLILAMLVGMTALGLGVLSAFPVPDGQGKEDAEKKTAPFRLTVDLADGSRVVGQSSDLKELRLRASFGEVTIPIDQVQSLQLKDEQGTTLVRFHNGDQLTGILDLKAVGDLKLTTALGETTVPLKLLTRFQIDAAPGLIQVSSARASSSGESTEPNGAFQPPEKGTWWNSGGDAPGWLEADFGKVRKLDTITLDPAQTPKTCNTVHELWVSNEPIGNDYTKARLVHTFRGETEDRKPLKHTFGPDVIGRYVQIRTLESESWVAWYHIDIMAR
jgi:RNA polymerase sigma factor (sigma-70 family)